MGSPNELCVYGQLSSFVRLVKRAEHIVALQKIDCAVLNGLPLIVDRSLYTALTPTSLLFRLAPVPSSTVTFYHTNSNFLKFVL